MSVLGVRREEDLIVPMKQGTEDVNDSQDKENVQPTNVSATSFFHLVLFVFLINFVVCPQIAPVSDNVSHKRRHSIGIMKMVGVPSCLCVLFRQVSLVCVCRAVCSSMLLCVFTPLPTEIVFC